MPSASLSPNFSVTRPYPAIRCALLPRSPRLPLYLSIQSTELPDNSPKTRDNFLMVPKHHRQLTFLLFFGRRGLFLMILGGRPLILFAFLTI